METTLYTTTIPPMQKTLDALAGLLDSLSAHAAKFANERRPAAYFEEALLQSRLVFDQFPFLVQVRIVCDNAKNGAARLAEVEPPAFADDETTVAELKARVVKTQEFLKTLSPEQLAGKEDIRIALPYWDGKTLSGHEYAALYLMPNFYFHFTTAYSILRHNGVPVGKSDYMGALPLQ